MSQKVKPLSSTTHQYKTHTNAHINGLLTPVLLELPNLSSKLHCSFAACAWRRWARERTDKHNYNKNRTKKRKKKKETEENNSMTDIMTRIK